VLPRREGGNRKGETTTLEFIIPLLLAIIVVELGVAIMTLDAIAKKP
jgi:hypothetical protein